ncbi:hypothetical protein E2C01_009488 [Portunus trituberculatus]|uniref:Uncharacterized protein n=1 Tax=Portunus trituberculatus TaxID=210409 RepID=A0A5B7D5X7_PORTR|nr:hypothetical protein [Portunus trituberculatus]
MTCCRCHAKTHTPRCGGAGAAARVVNCDIGVLIISLSIDCLLLPPSAFLPSPPHILPSSHHQHNHTSFRHHLVSTHSRLITSPPHILPPRVISSHTAPQPPLISSSPSPSRSLLSHLPPTQPPLITSPVTSLASSLQRLTSPLLTSTASAPKRPSTATCLQAAQAH